MVQTGVPAMNTRVQARLDAHQGRLDQLTNQMQDFSTMMISMNGMLEKVLQGQKKIQGKKINDEADGEFAFKDQSDPIVTKGSPSSSSFKVNKEQPIDTSLFSLPKVKLPQFEGIDPRGWITKAELYFQVNQTPVDQKLRLAQMCMEGIALNWYTNLLVKHPRTNWNQFKDKLMIRFSGTKFRNAHEALGSLYQEGDDIEGYIEEFEAISSLIPDQTRKNP